VATLSGQVATRMLLESSRRPKVSPICALYVMLCRFSFLTGARKRAPQDCICDGKLVQSKIPEDIVVVVYIILSYAIGFCHSHCAVYYIYVPFPIASNTTPYALSVAHKIAYPCACCIIRFIHSFICILQLCCPYLIIYVEVRI